MTRYSTIRLYHGKLKFSAGHFTVFSSDRRERLHGHNYTLEAAFVARVDDNGMTRDYRTFKSKLKTLCDQLNTRFLLPENSPYLKIFHEGDHIHVDFAGKRMSLLKDDVLILPLTNITLEELSYWFVQQLSADDVFMASNDIRSMSIQVYNGVEQSAESRWEL